MVGPGGAGKTRLVAEIVARDAAGPGAVSTVDLRPGGAPRRDWVLTLISDGYLTVRDPDKQRLWEIADAAGTDVRLYAA